MRRRRKLADAGDFSAQTGLFEAKTKEQLDEEQRLELDIAELREELERITYFQNADEEQLMLIVMDLERYHGRSLPWYLGFCEEASEEDYPGLPKASDYDIGCYGHEQQPGSFKFVKDRLVWAKEYHEELLKEALERFHALTSKRMW